MLVDGDVGEDGDDGAAGSEGSAVESARARIAAGTRLKTIAGGCAGAGRGCGEEEGGEMVRREKEVWL